MLIPEEFNDLIDELGQDVLWRPSYACPCVNAKSGAAKPDCPVCSGKGRTWDDPIRAYVGMTGMGVKRQFAQFGVVEVGDVVVTLPSDSKIYAISQFDRVIMVNSSEPFSRSMKRGADVLRGMVASVDRVFWLDGSQQIVEGGIPDVADDGSLTWSSGAPPSGSFYSITGRVRPEYFVYLDLPFDRAHQHGSRLPRRVVLRKFDLFGR